MPELTMIHATGAPGHGGKHAAKAGTGLPVSAEMFFQVLSGRLDAKASLGLADGALTEGVGQAGLPASEADGDAALASGKSGRAAPGDADILAQFASQLATQSVTPSVTPSIPQSDPQNPGQLPGEATAGLSTAEAGLAAAIALASGDAPARAELSAQIRAARTDEGAAAPGMAAKIAGEAAGQATVAHGPADQDAEAETSLPAFLEALQAKRSDHAAMATSAGDGQGLPRAESGKPAKLPSGDSARVAASSADAGKDAAAPVGTRAGQEEGAAVLDQMAGGTGTEQSDLLQPAMVRGSAPTDAGQAMTHARPFDHLMRGAETKLHVAVDAPVRSSGFPAEFGEKIVWLAGRQGQWAELSLTPPHLGTVEVRLSMSGGEAGAQFYSANASVREAMEAALPKLRELMAEAGINLGQASVRDERFPQRDGGEAQAQGAGDSSQESGGISLQTADASLGRARSGLGLVDLYI